ncbi:FAD-dependent oxidoreductase [Gangjinia marincola]|uniref:FAD-dependent oxidoreductase n=1 Tax=Gangjinia marincola TaxID=578463 RepID=A0ABP3XQB6_9FLAO
MNRDVIIVGFGLAGLCVAEQLQRQNQSVVVISDTSQQSSRVAGGLFNPVILKRFKLAWKADDQLPVALDFYLKLQQKLSQPFLKMIPVLKRFESIQDQHNWNKAIRKPELESFLTPKIQANDNAALNADFGLGRVAQTGTVDTNALLNAYISHLESLDSILRETFDYDKLDIAENDLQYKNVKAKKIIFCEGFGVLKNPFFNWIKIQGNKGEYLIIRSSKLNVTAAVKSSIFIIPLGNDLYKVGATYERDHLTQTPSVKAKNYLIKELNALITWEYDIVDQVAGIRPTVSDRKPVLGQHPQYKNLYCCNGFGSRGVLMGPSMAKVIVDNMLCGHTVPKELDVNRFN